MTGQSPSRHDVAGLGPYRLVALSAREGYGIVYGEAGAILATCRGREDPLHSVSEGEVFKLASGDPTLRPLRAAQTFDTVDALVSFIRSTRARVWVQEGLADLLSNRYEDETCQHLIMAGLVEEGQHADVEHFDPFGLASVSTSQGLARAWRLALSWDSEPMFVVLTRVTQVVLRYALRPANASLGRIGLMLTKAGWHRRGTPGSGYLMVALAGLDDDAEILDVGSEATFAEMRRHGSLRLAPGISVGWARSALPPPRLAIRGLVRRLLRERGVRVGAGFLEALDRKVDDLIQAAIERARANKRNSVRGYDL